MRSLKIYPIMQSHVPKIFVHVIAGVFLSGTGEDGTEEPTDRLHDSLLLEVKPPVDSLERMNLKMAQSVRGFRESRPAPEPEAEGALCVVSADGKGIPIRRSTSEVPIEAHDRDQKPKTNRKKMAVVGSRVPD